MNPRRSRDRAQRLAQVRWLGWVMLMMFVLVQSAMGAGVSGTRAERPGELRNRLLQASADFDASTQQVTVKANVPVSAWDAFSGLRQNSLSVNKNTVRQPLESIEFAHPPSSTGILLDQGGGTTR